MTLWFSNSRSVTALAGSPTSKRSSPRRDWAGLSYVAWGTGKTEIAGPARFYDPESDVEREFTVMADGEPVLTSSDLDAFEHFGTAEALLCEVRKWLRLPKPETVGELEPDTLTIVIQDDEPEESFSAARKDDVSCPR